MLAKPIAGESRLITTLSFRAASRSGGGSYILLHIWRSPDRGTAGRTGMARKNPCSSGSIRLGHR